MFCGGSIGAVQGLLIINMYDYIDAVTMPQTLNTQQRIGEKPAKNKLWQLRRG